MISLRSRRGLYITLAAVLIITFFYLTTSLDTGKLRQIVPHKSDDHELATDSDLLLNGNVTTADDNVSDVPYTGPGTENVQIDEGKSTIDVGEGQNTTESSTENSSGGDQELDAEEGQDEGEAANDVNDATGDEDTPKKFVHSGKPGSQSPSSSVTTSQLHFLIPADHATVRLCYNIVSAAANRYPAPILVGWNGKGDFSAKKTHLAKLRSIERYLDSLPPSEDDDLVLIIDGYDVLMQLPPEILIERYFQLRIKEDQKMAERMGITVEEAHNKGYKQTIFWGADKICWPVNWDAPRCWAVPSSGLPKGTWGPNPDDGELWNNDPKWLNSGTVIGPIGDFRNMIHDTMMEINQTWNGDFYGRNSDQFYLANVWGRQEYHRSKAFSKDGKVEGSEGSRQKPKQRGPDHKPEFHISSDYESTLFQPKIGSEDHFGYAEYDKEGMNATMKMDMSRAGVEKEDIHMPENVQRSLSKLYDSIPGSHPGKTAKEWLPKVSLGTNWVTKNIFALWHCTGDKWPVDEEYTRFWWFPFAYDLIKSNVAVAKGTTEITTEGEGFDGRKWVGKTSYPKDGGDALGGAWSDEKTEREFLKLGDLCGQWYGDALFPKQEEHEQVAEEGGKGTLEDGKEGEGKVEEEEKGVVGDPKEGDQEQENETDEEAMEEMENEDAEEEELVTDHGEDEAEQQDGTLLTYPKDAVPAKQPSA